MAARRVRWAAAVLAAVALVALFAAPSASPTEPKYPRRIPVRLWHMWTAEWAVVVERICQRFNESQDTYEVIPLSVPAQGADSKFLLAAVGGDPPDVMAQWNPVIPTWAENRLLTPLDELMTAEERERFEREAYPVVKKLGYYKGRLYGITTGMNAFALYYLPAHFRDAGLEPEIPPTLEELVAVGDRLKRVDAAGHLSRIGYLPTHGLGGMFGISPVFGGGFYDWKTGTVTIDTPENLRTLRFLVEQRRKLGFDEVVRFESGLNTQSFAGGWPFIGGAYSATQDGQWRVEQIRKYAPRLQYRTAPLPPPREGGVPLAGASNGNFLIIPRASRNPKGAFEFVKFWTGVARPERAAEFYTWGGWLPISPAVVNAPIYQEYLRKNPQFKTFVDLIASPHLEVYPPVPYQVFLMDQITRVEDLAVRGTLTPEQALQRLKVALEQERTRRRQMGYVE